MIMTMKMKPLTAADRCDRCGARASVRAGMVHGDLLFCAHDWHLNEEAIRKQTDTIQDERNLRFDRRDKK